MTAPPHTDLIAVLAALLAVKLGDQYAPLVATYLIILIIAVLCASLALNASSTERTTAQSRWFVFTAVAVAFLFTVAVSHLIVSMTERWLGWKTSDAVLLPLVAGAIAGTRDYWSAGFAWAWKRVASLLGKPAKEQSE